MSHSAFKELAEGMQQRLEQRCTEDGHLWEWLDGVCACRWCHALSDTPEQTIDWKARALSHATVVRALLAVRQPPAGTAGEAWLAEANETLKLGSSNGVLR